MPVKSADLDVLIGKAALGDTRGDHPKIGNSGGDVKHMETGQCKKGAAKQRNTPGIGRQSNAFMNQAEPFVNVKNDEAQAAYYGVDDIANDTLGVTSLG